MWLVETGPLGFVIARTITEGGADWQLFAALAGALGLSVGGAATRLSARMGSVMVTGGLAALLGAMAPSLVYRPLLGFVLLLLAVGFTAWEWSPQLLVDLTGRPERKLRAQIVDVRLAAAAALVAWLVGVASATVIDPWIALASALASALAVSRAAAWMPGVLTGWPRAVWLALLATALVATAVTALTGSLGTALSILALVPLGTMLLARVRGVEVVDTSWAGLILDHPARLIVATFLLLCASGALFLSFPACSAGPAISRVDAAFTAVSAVCVTGLITLDTPHAWSGLGQFAIMLLIQLGGLGIMTLLTAALGALGRRLSVRHEEAVAGMFGEHRGLLYVALRRTLAVTFAAEAAGAALLMILFWYHGDGFASGLWRGVFTSVSAFCNAGFALQTDSLIPYQTDPAVLHVVGILIVAGGLAPAVITALPRLVRGRSVPLQVKVVLAATAAALVIGWLGFAALEWNHTLDGLSIADKLHNAWFQSITYRTAGFNSVDFAHLRDASLPLACALMFVGGAPGGTAGGIKVTTAWVLFAAVAGALRGEADATSFQRKLPHRVIYRAIAITTIYAGMLLMVLMGIFLTQSMSGDKAVFEVFSAIGTVGLSIGGTSQLDGLGKVIIMIAMFLGRVGPLTMFLFLIERQTGVVREQLDESVEVG